MHTGEATRDGMREGGRVGVLRVVRIVEWRVVNVEW